MIHCIQFPPVVQSTVFIVEDQVTNRTILSNITKAINSTIEVKCFDNATDVLAEVNHSAPDMILTDYKIHGTGGEQFILELRNNIHCRDIPIVVITVLDDLDTLYKAFEAGATDFITKPVDPYECKIRFSNLLSKQKQQLFRNNRTSLLEKRVQDATDKIIMQEHEMLIRLAKAGEYRSKISGSSLIRMGQFVRVIAEAMNFDKQRRMILMESATIHDIGKIGIPDNILLKNGPLNEAEFATIKKHPHIGYDILKNSPSPYLEMGAMIALQHHEKFDGNGYPFGLKGDKITIETRIATIADVFDALISARPYKKAWPFDKAFSHIIDNSGGHFDPECVNAFVSQKEKVLEIIASFKK